MNYDVNRLMKLIIIDVNNRWHATNLFFCVVFWLKSLNELTCLYFILFVKQQTGKKNSPETGYRWFSFPKNVNTTLRKRRLRSDTKTFRPDKKRGFSPQTEMQSLAYAKSCYIYLSLYVFHRISWNIINVQQKSGFLTIYLHEQNGVNWNKLLKIQNSEENRIDFRV